MRFSKNNFTILLIIMLMLLYSQSIAFAENSRLSEFDAIRGQMSYLKDKNSQEYINLKQKINRIVSQQKIPYAKEDRFNDAMRLIREQKYNAAIYELNSLIDEGYNLSRCYELLGDICINTKQPVKKTVQYYKNALKYNQNSASVLYKLSKIYLSENKNIMGMEYLAALIQNTNDYSILNDIENTIVNSANPTNAYEVNNFYETLAAIQMKLGKKDDAYKNYVKALQANPDDIFLKYSLVNMLYKDNCPSDVIKIIDIILEQKKDDYQLRTTKAKAYAMNGDLNSAYKEYVNILKENPDSKQAKYGIYKLLKGKMSLGAILGKINFDKPGYVATKIECINFAKFLDTFNDKEGANQYRNLAFQMQEEERKQIEYRQQQERLRQEQLALEKQRQEEERQRKIEQERLRQEQLALEKQRQEEEKQKLRELELKRQEELKLKKQREYEEQQAKLKAQKEAQEAKLKAQKEAQEAKLKAQKEAQEAKLKAQKEAQEAKLKAQKEAQEAKLKAQKEAQQAKLKAQKEAQEAKLKAQKEAQERKRQQALEKQEALKQQAELKAQQEKLRQEKLAAEKQRQLELQKQKERELKEQKEREEKRLAELKAQQEQARKEKEQKEYEQRKAAQELKTFQTKNPTNYAKYNQMLSGYLNTEPKDASTYLAIANTYKLMEAPTSAIRYYKEAIKLSPNDSDLYYSMALSYIELDSFETAYLNIDKALKLDENNSKAKNLLPFVKQKLTTKYINEAYSKFENKNYLEASTVLDEAIKKIPDGAQLYYYRALSYDAMNRNAAAIMDLQKATSLNPSLYMAFYQLGKSYEKIKDERNALVAYERFLSTEPDEKDLIEEVQKKVVLLGQKYY